MLLKAALGYAGRGVPVFPCGPGAKRPLTRNGHWDATTDPRIVERWWRRWPSANVGVPTGKKSGVVVLDVDPDAGGLESLANLERAGGRSLAPCRILRAARMVSSTSPVAVTVLFLAYNPLALIASQQSKARAKYSE